MGVFIVPTFKFPRGAFQILIRITRKIGILLVSLVALTFLNWCRPFHCPTYPYIRAGIVWKSVTRSQKVVLFFKGGQPPHVYLHVYPHSRHQPCLLMRDEQSQHTQSEQTGPLDEPSLWELKSSWPRYWLKIPYQPRHHYMLGRLCIHRTQGHSSSVVVVFSVVAARGSSWI